MALIYPERGSDDMVAKYEQLKVLMATTFKDVTDEYFGSCMEWMEADRVLKFTMDDVKWYPSYADVQMFDKMLEAFGDDIPGYCTEFVRVGEESDDVEQRQTGENNEYYLQVRREIDCNV
jgi:hypothetical protein